MAKITSYISTIFMVLIFISVAPGLILKIKDEYKVLLEPHVKIASVEISNKIMDINDYQEQLKKYFENKDIKAILLKIDSPGGASGSSQALFNEIIELKKLNPKPVIAMTTDLCASGAYYIACTADHIVSTPSAMIGSIGSFIGYFNVKNLINKYNVSYIEKHSGKYKTVANPFAIPTEDNNKMLQELSNDVYRQFTKDVATSRKLSLKDKDKWADGKVFTGEQALKLGLIDEIGSKTNAVNKIRELALIKKEERIIWVKKKAPNALEKMLESKSNINASADSIVDAVISKLQSGSVLVG